MNNKKIKRITIADLAKMIKEDVVDHMATKTDIDGLKEEIKGVKNQLEGTNKRLDDIAVTRVKYEDFKELTGRVEKLELK